MDILKLQKKIKSSIKINEYLSKYTSLGLGGRADFFIDCESIMDLKKILDFAGKNKLKIFVLGAATNVLIKDGGIRGIVIRLKGEFEDIKASKTRLICGAGAKLQKVLNYCVRNGLTGLEFVAGIPGTIGGAIFMNAGIKTKEIKDVLLNVTTLNKRGIVRKINRKNIKFGYRESEFKNNGLIILKVEIKTNKGSIPEIKEEIKTLLNKRKQTQPGGLNNAGCIFKNPKGESAGKIIDECGLKGFSIGKVMVSEKHTNFFINKGRTSKDVISLIKEVKKIVKSKRGIDLTEEIIIVGED